MWLVKNQFDDAKLWRGLPGIDEQIIQLQTTSSLRCHGDCQKTMDFSNADILEMPPRDQQQAVPSRSAAITYRKIPLVCAEHVPIRDPQAESMQIAWHGCHSLPTYNSSEPYPVVTGRQPMLSDELQTSHTENYYPVQARTCKAVGQKQMIADMPILWQR